MAKNTGNTWIGKRRFDVKTQELWDGDGQEIPLRAQSAKVLGELVARRGVLVSKAELMERVWAETFVTDDSLVKCISDIRKALGADAQLLATIPRRGYRLAEGPPSVAFNGENRRASPSPLRQIAVLVALVLIVGTAMWAVAQNGVVQSDDSTLAVLPF